MAIFDDVPIGWAGKTYTIPAQQVMRAIARVEDHVTLEELIRFQERGTVPLAKMAAAYASLICFAGGTATADEVYKNMLGLDEGGVAGTTIAGLLHMMVPPTRLVEGMTAPAGKQQPAGVGLSSKPIKRRSAQNGSIRPNSGR